MAERPEYPLQTAFELFRFGCEMRAERHRREHPDATEAEVQAVVRAWLQERPGAEHGDAVGRPGDPARFS